MSISFDKALGIHDKALAFRTQRAEILANNIANADTPHYKARDVDFASLLAEQQRGSESRFALARTQAQHLPAEGFSSNLDGFLRYRIAGAPSLDQNTVDLQVEQASYAENAVQFQASFTLLNNKFKGLTNALRGE